MDSVTVIWQNEAFTIEVLTHVALIKIMIGGTWLSASMRSLSLRQSIMKKLLLNKNSED